MKNSGKRVASTETGRAPRNLVIDPLRREDVEERDGDFWVERDAVGEYSDVGSETEAEILVELREAPWRDVVRQRFGDKNPWLYKIITDGGRALFLDFIPAKRDGVYLDVGSGWGQVAIPLARWGRVFCMDVTLSRLDLLKEIARQEGARLGYVRGNFRTFPFAPGQFDLVILNGTLEWLALGATDASIWEIQTQALRKTREILKPDGLVYVGIENSLGLKYLLGAPDDHSGIPHMAYLSEIAAGVRCRDEGTDLRAKTWSLAEYRELFRLADLDLVQVYACFPDYKLIRCMIPIEDVNGMLIDRGLPFPEHSGSDGSALSVSGSLDALYRLLGRNGIGEYFCPSYGLIARRAR